MLFCIIFPTVFKSFLIILSTVCYFISYVNNPFLARRDYVPGELMLSPSRWRRRLSASALAQCLSFQRCA